jgi:bis(5'-nucleosidyl)-tetraphosphatase
MARHERSAGFICFRRRDDVAGGVEYLLLDYGRHWEYAKGHVDPGESDLDAAVRELREEAGITEPSVVDGFRHELVYFFRDRGKGLIRKTVVFFLAETNAADADVVLSHEHVAFAFLPYDQAVKRVTFAGARQVLKAAHERLTADVTGARSGSPASDAPGLFDPANPPPAGA